MIELTEKEKRLKMLDKIRKLKAIANGTKFDGYARACKYKIDDLCERYGISDDEVSEPEEVVRWPILGCSGYRRMIRVFIGQYLGFRMYKSYTRGSLIIYCTYSEYSIFTELVGIHEFFLRDMRKKHLKVFDGMVLGYGLSLFPPPELDEKGRRRSKFDKYLVLGYEKGIILAAQNAHLSGRKQITSE